MMKSPHSNHTTFRFQTAFRAGAVMHLAAIGMNTRCPERFNPSQTTGCRKETRTASRLHRKTRRINPPLTSPRGSLSP